MKMAEKVIFIITSILLGVGLAMDAFSVSLANGMQEPSMKRRKMCGIAGVFAGFQALMPLLGWLLGRQFESLITSIDHWVVFALLTVIGVNMIFPGMYLN